MGPFGTLKNMYFGSAASRCFTCRTNAGSPARARFKSNFKDHGIRRNFVVNSAEEALTVVRHYECRWRIEEYHKAWKSGVGVERQRFQSLENLERMLAITAFLAVRLLQLRESQDAPVGKEDRKCDEVLSEDEWKILWVSTEHRPPPPLPPSIRWADLTPCGMAGFVCKSASRATNSASVDWLNCDQETELCRGLTSMS